MIDRYLLFHELMLCWQMKQRMSYSRRCLNKIATHPCAGLSAASFLTKRSKERSDCPGVGSNPSFVPPTGTKLAGDIDDISFIELPYANAHRNKRTWRSQYRSPGSSCEDRPSPSKSVLHSVELAP